MLEQNRTTSSALPYAERIIVSNTRAASELFGCAMDLTQYCMRFGFGLSRAGMMLGSELSGLQMKEHLDRTYWLEGNVIYPNRWSEQ